MASVSLARVRVCTSLFAARRVRVVPGRASLTTLERRVNSSPSMVKAAFTAGACELPAEGSTPVLPAVASKEMASAAEGSVPW